MSILATVRHDNAQIGMRVVFSGVEKIGKTTLACSAPRPLLVPLEQGFAGITVSRTPLLDSFASVTSLLGECLGAASHGQFPYRSIVFDSATALERLIHAAVLQSDPAFAAGNKRGLTMESALGGYGKAYQFANELLGKFFHACDWLATSYGINIVLTCHVFAAKVIDPAFGEYDTWDLLLHSPKNQKTYGKREMLTQWADVIGFLHEPVFISEGKTLNRGMTTNQGRILAVNRTPGFVAGNRYGVVADIPIPSKMGWNCLAHAVYNASGRDFFNRD